jgi:predicted MFS family arabinose efflux permease
VGTLIAAVFVWMLGAALVLPFFNLYFQRVHALEVEDIGLIFAATQALTAVAVFGGGELAQRLGPRRAFGVWATLLPSALLALVLGPGAWLAVPLFAIQGLPSPATNPLLDEIVLDAAPPEQRGAASSWRNGATEASGLVGAGLGGVLLERAGFGLLMAVAAAVAALGALALIRSFSRRAL